jgi:hypothetical protein
MSNNNYTTTTVAVYSLDGKEVHVGEDINLKVSSEWCHKKSRVCLTVGTTEIVVSAEDLHSAIKSCTL